MDKEKKPITQDDLCVAIKTEIRIFLKEHQEEIIKRAHLRLRRIRAEEASKK